jgi:hypothetical protein
LIRLQAFSNRLAEIIGRPSTERPFVSDGDPAAFPVWVVGYNPATTGGDWWQYWSDECGFDKAAWRADYDAERAARGKGPSATRQRIDRISQAVPGVLETNIFGAPSTRMANMPTATTTAFDFLVEALRPRIIVAFGVEAQRHLEGWKGGLLLSARHFSRASYAEVDEIIARINRLE